MLVSRSDNRLQAPQISVVVEVVPRLKITRDAGLERSLGGVVLSGRAAKLHSEVGQKQCR